jgi:hypothetical protein
MSKRISILTAITEKLKLINGELPYTTNIFNNAYPKIKFWDEVNDFPCIYGSAGGESREYLPSNLTWAYLGISLKIYTKGENSQLQLENLLEDIETVINNNRVLVYDTANNYETTEILVVSITTDEGLLAPYAVGEINLQVRYQLM